MAAIVISCPHCKHWVEVPDGEAKWRQYAMDGMAIKSVVERVLLEPRYYEYITPKPLMIAAAIWIPVVGVGVPFAMWFGVPPVLTSVLMCASFGMLLIATSAQQGCVQIEEEDDEDEDGETEMPVSGLESVETTSHTMSIKLLYEPPTGDTRAATVRLSRAALALAQLATGEDALEWVSFDNARARNYKFGEPTFAIVQRQWRDLGLARLDACGKCYLSKKGLAILSAWAEAHSPTA